MIYKKHDKVLFTFLGQKTRGVILEKLSNGKYRIKADDGTVYGFILASEPKPTKKKSSELILTKIVTFRPFVPRPVVFENLVLVLNY